MSRSIGGGIPDRAGGTVRSTPAKARLADVIEDAGTRRCATSTTFGDGWEPIIKIERLGDPEPGVAYRG